MRHAIMICLLAAAAHAEPSPGVQWLMNEPVSMLEWGMYRLDLTLDSFAQEAVSEATGSETGFYVTYSGDRNRIVIHTGLEPMKGDNAVSVPPPKDRIRKAFSEMRRLLLEIVEGDTASFLLENAFSHHGFDGASQPENLFGELIELTELEVSCRVSDEGHYTEAFAPLLGTDIFFKE